MYNKFGISLIALFLLFSFNLFAQPNGPWVKTQNSPDKTFAEYQKEFYEYWENKTPEKGQGFKQFKRWEHFWQTRLLKDGRLPSSAFIWSVVQEAKKSIGSDATKDQSLWSAMGPTDYELTGSWSAGHGRVNVVTVDPNDPNTIYIGAPAGGIWRSTDGGQNWTVLNDQLGVIGVSSIAIDPNNSDIIYIATGDDDAHNTYSIGIMKTTDGGTTWNTTGLTLTGSSRVSNVVLDPNNSQIVYAATNSGLYKSTNGGASFSVIFAQSVLDFAFKPGDSQTIYTVTSSSFYRSTNGGSTFSQITSGLPGSDVSRIVIGVTPANPAYIYLSVANNGNGYKGLYRSTNSGTSFSLRGNSPDIYESSQAWYDLAIAVDPSNAEIVYNGVLNIWKSTNGGVGFTKMNSWSNPTGASYTHADIHYLGFYGSALFCGSDGGVYKSTNGAVNFTDLSPGLQIGQFYAIDGTEQNSDAVVGGLQDNGGYYTQSGDGGWKNYYGADGMGCAIDFTNQNVVYGAIQFGNPIYKSTNGGNSISSLNPPESGAWVTPLQLDPNNNNRLLVGYTKLYEYNGGWNALTTYDFGGVIGDFEVAPSNSNVIYFAKGSNLFKTTNGGASVSQLSGLPGEPITDIEVHNTDQNTLWITFGNWTDGTKVYKSVDGGSSWTNISGTLPNFPFNCVVYQHDSNGAIYVGNDIGVYYYDETIGVWDDYLNDLPHTIVSDLVINHTSSVITAGTYGRGVWQSALYNSTLNAIDPFLVEIVNVDDIVCNTSISPGVRVKNLGTEDLTSFTLEYGIGNYNLSYNWTGNLVSLADTTINLNPISISDGALVFQVRVVNPNGGPDDNESNNQKEVNFNAVTNGEPVTVHLETDCWGEETTWEIRDDQNNVIISEGPFNDLAQLDFPLCLDVGCYQFIINDSFGDGMFGSQYGTCGVDGDYSIADGQGNVLVQMADPDFGFQAVHDFCVVGNGLEVSFSASSTQECQGATIDFTDLSLGDPVSWAWEFAGGNPATSDMQNPTGILYASPGSFDVTLTITNSDGDEVSDTFTDYITVSEPPVFNVFVIDVLCFGSDNGEISMEVISGNPPYLYSIDGGVTFQSDNFFFGVSPGTYQVIVKDALGCMSASDVTVNESPEIIVNVDQTNQVSCFAGNDGEIMIQATGGVPPFTFNVNGGPFQTDSVFNGLTAGVYSFEVKDDIDCIIFGDFTIDEPEPIVVEIQTEDMACFNGEVGGSYIIIPSGGTGILTVVGIDPQADDVAPGVYDFSVVDANGCSADFEFEIFEPEAISVTTEQVDVTCFGLNDGSVTLNASGGTPPFEYALNGAEFTSVNMFDNLSQGDYTYLVRDANGCIVDGAFAISEPEELVISTSTVSDEVDGNDGSIEIEVTGGTPAYTFLWSNGSTDQNIFGLSAGVYTVIITDANGCTFEESFTVTSTVGVEELLLNDIKVFPNPANDQVFIKLNNSFDDMLIEFLTDNGKIVRSKVISEEKEIKFNVSDLSAGTYFIKLNYQGNIKTIKVLLVK